MPDMNRIYVVGAGCFGTAIANSLAQNKRNQVVVYAKESEVVESINSQAENALYFPGRKINENILAVDDFSKVSDSDFVFLAVPSGVIEAVACEIKEMLSPKTIVINLAKGLAADGRTLVEGLEEILDNCIASLKGPTFAVEMLSGNSSALTVAANNESDFAAISFLFDKTNILLDFTLDIKGCEMLGVLKNIYAIAIGVVSGQCNSPNVSFLVFSKVLNEIRTILAALGGKEETIFKFCGCGDLALTALNDLSRNRTLGLLIGKGFWDERMTSSIVLEGYRCIAEIHRKLTEAFDLNYENRCPIIYYLQQLVKGKMSSAQYLTKLVL